MEFFVDVRCDGANAKCEARGELQMRGAGHARRGRAPDARRKRDEAWRNLPAWARRGETWRDLAAWGNEARRGVA